MNKIKYLCIIQSRLNSSRFPGKVLQLVKGKTMVKRVWEAAKDSLVDKVIVLWPERNPDIPETDLYTPFCRLVDEFKPRYLVRLTADCPLITAEHINKAIIEFELGNKLNQIDYYNNGLDGFDVQIFTPEYMKTHPNKQHVLEVEYNYNGLSVNTKEELERIKLYAK